MASQTPPAPGGGQPNLPSGAQVVRWYQHTGDPELYEILRKAGIPVQPPPPGAKPGALKEFVQKKMEMGQSPLAVSTPDGRPAPETVAEIDGQPVDGAVQLQEARMSPSSRLAGGMEDTGMPPMTGGGGTDEEPPDARS